MSGILRALLVVTCALTLSACRFGDPGTMLISMSAYTDRPVVVTEMAVNGQAVPLVPAVVRGRADTGRPDGSSGGWLLGYPPGKSGVMQLDLAWVELPKGAAYRTTLQVPLDALETSGSGAAAFMPVFAPGGLLVIASDPVPKSASDTTTRDVARICGKRTPAADVNYAATPRELPELFEALEAALSTPAASEC